MRRFGLIGHPVSHSFSPDFFAKKFEREHIHHCTYEAYDLPNLDRFHEFCQAMGGFSGLNVTLPHKVRILSLCDVVDPQAAEIGSVNTLLIRNHRIYGFNTDIIGLEASLMPFLNKPHQKALILGDGGASWSAVFLLRKRNIPFLQLSRKPDAAKQQIYWDALTPEIATDYTLWIQCTPLGMYPEIHEKPPVPYHLISKEHVLFDMIYRPDETAFLAEGRRQGAIVKNGLDMLRLQAEASWQIWNDFSPPTK